MAGSPDALARLEPASRSPQVVLLGTALSVRQLAASLALTDPPPHVLGCLLPHVPEGPADLPAAYLGTFADLADVLHTHRPDQALITLPLSMETALRDLAHQLEQAGVRWSFCPTLSDQLAGRTNTRLGAVAAPAGEPIDTARLIDRQPRPLHEDSIRRVITGQRVMITGAGGSIGSELARIAARFGPAELLLVERGENALFEIDREIGRIFPDLGRRALLHDITDAHRTDDLLAEHRPDVILHAAAHKHVPMMEDHPAAAVENNFYGTQSIADAAHRAGCRRFVMISTDKAVNPSSVMGASKRLAELYIQHLNQRSTTTFAMVRFGNVLGSACSVLPIWTEQLSRGGPVTVTHPEMTRYFMTIPEAAGLVIQAAALAQGGEVFLLDMGAPVRILDLARRFIRSRGFEPDVDVPVQLTGIRPGEKLFEELAYGGEDKAPTPHPSIAIWRTTPPDDATMTTILRTFDHLRDAGEAGLRWRRASRDAIVHALRASIPEMTRAAAG